MHIGTFTREGTWEAAIAQLPELARLGITVLEVMPVADFCGSFGWGYDGVNLYAPTRLYGGPDDFRRFVDGAHALGMAVILDVVYNHLGPDGCYVREFTPAYFTDRYDNEWGDPLNFDGPDNAGVREYFTCNAGYWVDEYHLDGLRLDATQQIFDASGTHVTVEVTRRVREAARGRATLVIAENEPQHARLVARESEGGYGMDALWNDDYHHSAHVAATGHNEAYYSDYLGTPQELLSAVKWGYLYQGQRYHWQKKRRGTPALRTPRSAFVNCVQNHDQIANSAFGLRLHQATSPGRYRALTALTLLAPGIPMLFMGQEFAASAPFVFFADHKPELAAAVRKGRAEFVSQFPSVASAPVQALLHDPADRAAFERCKLDFSERESHAWAYALHRDLLALRRTEPALRAFERHALDGAVLGEECFVLRFFHEDGDRLLVVNLGRDLHLAPAPEPLLAPPEGERWRNQWCSEDPLYGGNGSAELETEEEGWRIPRHSATLLRPGDA
jgi:maltooligosyltrehalose trehalohydrolase